MIEQEFNVLGKLTADLTCLQLDHADRLSRMWRMLKDETLEITFKKFYRRRTAAQNRLIWGPIITKQLIPWYKENEGITYSKDALYAFLRIRVVGQEVQIVTIDGRDIPVVTGKPFSKMLTIEFNEAMEKIVAYYGERGLEIKLPDDDLHKLTDD